MHVQHVPQQVVDKAQSVVDDTNVLSRLNESRRRNRFSTQFTHHIRGGRRWHGLAAIIICQAAIVIVTIDVIIDVQHVLALAIVKVNVDALVALAPAVQLRAQELGRRHGCRERVSDLVGQEIVELALRLGRPVGVFQHQGVPFGGRLRLQGRVSAVPSVVGDHPHRQTHGSRKDEHPDHPDENQSVAIDVFFVQDGHRPFPVGDFDGPLVTGCREIAAEITERHLIEEFHRVYLFRIRAAPTLLLVRRGLASAVLAAHDLAAKSCRSHKDGIVLFRMGQIVDVHGFLSVLVLRRSPHEIGHTQNNRREIPRPARLVVGAQLDPRMHQDYPKGGSLVSREGISPAAAPAHPSCFLHE
mmetsp:Transcript_3795/g.8217  ORF Transcript_3795/g.8217 Transcript_3795/m.8217 type:complete len:357 (-) Transcript_3795:10-1080(-)